MSESLTEHKGRVAIVTGGSSGIGTAIVERLRLAGASVSVFDRILRSTTDAAPAAGAACPPVSVYQLDVSSEPDVEKAFKSVAAREGKVDYLICCAAIFDARPFLQLTSDEWRRTLDVNLTGSFLCCREAIRLMRAHRFGRIVVFSSMLARTGGINSAHYSASKGGVLGLARSLALEVAGENIRVNSVSPGITDTPQPRGHLSEEELYGKGKQIPLGRIGKVEDMVEACLFLLGDESSYFTGQDFRVNGGAALW
jgi:NAD(P)-dependent dehydrogenase (short-subunit alcohol dehydrogenase family)